MVILWTALVLVGILTVIAWFITINAVSKVAEYAERSGDDFVAAIIVWLLLFVIASLITILEAYIVQRLFL